MLCRTLSEMRLLCRHNLNFDKPGSQGPPTKKTALSGGKTEKNLSKFFWRLANTYKKYIFQKNWVKTVIPALSSGRSNLQRPIWGCHRQLDDRDHLVGQLTNETRAFLILGHSLGSSRKSVHERHRNSDGLQVKWSVFWAIWLKSQDP